MSEDLIPSGDITTRLIKNNKHVLSSNDPNELIKNILKLKKDKYLSSKLKRNSRKCYKKYFSIIIFNKKIEKFINKIN